MIQGIEAMATRLFVGNLPERVTQADLEELFSQVGRVVSPLLPRDRETGRPRGFAFVEMATEAEAESAVEKLNGLDFTGRALRVTLA